VKRDGFAGLLSQMEEKVKELAGQPS